MSHPDGDPTSTDRTFHAESASPATRAPAKPVSRRAEARMLRSYLNRAAPASRQAARDLSRAARSLPEDNPHRAALLAAAEQEAASADVREAARPPIPSRRRA